MRKDRIKPLFAILATADAGRIRQEAARQLREIQEEVNALNRDAKLIRDLAGRYGGAEDGLTPSERGAKIREAALALVGMGKTIVTPQEVIDHLQQTEGIVFDVKRPASVAGTVLARSDEFERLETNRFRFIPGNDSGEAN